MRLCSHFLVVYLCSSFACFPLRLCALYTDYWVLMATLGSIQDLSLCVCPPWSSFLNFVSRKLLARDSRSDKELLTGREAVHQSAPFAFLSAPSKLHRLLLQVPLPDQSPKARIGYQQSHHLKHHLHLLG